MPPATSSAQRLPHNNVPPRYAQSAAGAERAAKTEATHRVCTAFMARRLREAKSHSHCQQSWRTSDPQWQQPREAGEIAIQ